MEENKESLLKTETKIAGEARPVEEQMANMDIDPYDPALMAEILKYNTKKDT